MIDLKQELQNYTAINLKALMESRPDIPDNFKNSVILYNKALESINTGSEDIAIIELKKAIAMNPDFHEAVNLLGLCYSYIKDYAKAAEMFKRVVSAEGNSIKAIEYLRLMDANSGAGSSPEKKTRNSGTKVSGKTGSQKPFRLNGLSSRLYGLRGDLVKLALGIAFGILIMIVFNVLHNLQTDDYISASKNMQTTIDAESDSTDDSYELKYKELETRYNTMQDSLDAANAEIDYFANIKKLFEIESLLSSGELENAADMLVLLKTVDFRPADKEKYDSLYNDVIPKAAARVFNDGYRLYNSKDYQAALDKLGKIPVYGIKLPNMDRVLYYVAKSYMGLEDSRNAISNFDYIIQEYPESVYAKYSKSWIKQLQGQP